MNAQTDDMGAAIIAASLAPNDFILDLNGSLSIPDGFPLAAPWDLPSRLFRSPIEVMKPQGDKPRRMGLMHPGFADHPFVQYVESLLGIEIERDGITNEYGYTDRSKGSWFHAVDLISSGHWRQLLETAEFTNPRCIFQAVVHGCRFSHHEDKCGRGYISIAEAREIMRELGAIEPKNRAKTILSFSGPSSCKQDGGTEHWPINRGLNISAEEEAWAIIHGIEDGWFSHDRSGFLQWSPLGRDRFASSEGESFTEASGQAAFAF